MKIYTKGGDSGLTSLASGERVSKSSLRIAGYGTVDEVNSTIGMLCADLIKAETPAKDYLLEMLFRLQSQLFKLGSELAAHSPKKLGEAWLLQDDTVEMMEKDIDKMTAELLPLTNFILPGGHTSAAWAHLVRTKARHAERLVVELNETLSEDQKVRPTVIRFLNRLSDLFFTLARYINHLHRIDDVLWIGK